LHQALEIFQIFIMFFVIQLPFLISLNVWRKKNLLTHARIIAITSYSAVIVQLTLWPLITNHPSMGWADIPYNIKPFDSIWGSINKIRINTPQIF
jgi:glycopeptide antibiotics resistance protein